METPDPRILQPEQSVSRPPVVRQRLEACSSIDPPVVNKVLATTTITGQARSFQSDPKNWEDVSKGPKIDEVYGVPRVFDLFTLMAITLAFALLFALLKLLSPAFDAAPTTLTLIISGYVTLIALAQMFMFQGKNPRLSSISAGPIAMLGLIMAAWVPFGGMSLIPALIGSVIFSVVFGFFFGYLSGAVVAGVLLVADALRGRSVLRKGPLITSEKDIAFDDVE